MRAESNVETCKPLIILILFHPFEFLFIYLFIVISILCFMHFILYLYFIVFNSELLWSFFSFHLYNYLYKSVIFHSTTFFTMFVSFFLPVHLFLVYFILKTMNFTHSLRTCHYFFNFDFRLYKFRTIFFRLCYFHLFVATLVKF